MKANIYLCALALCASTTVYGAAPEGYYSSCNGKSKGSLKSQLYTIVKDHKALSYSDDTWKAFHFTDIDANGCWWDIYTTNHIEATDNKPDNSVMNVEHTFPKSWWGGAKNDAYKDIVHLMPVNSIANSTRGNVPYAEVENEASISDKCTNPRFKVGTPKSGQGGGSNRVFEPDDEFKGDLARTYFYMVTCYQNLSWSNDGLRTAATGTYPTLQPWAIELLLRWHRNDPVDQKERDRNDGVYEQQHNRNPFIDHPELVEHIWGDKTEIGWQSGEPDPGPGPEPGDEPATLTSPIDNDWYHFVGVHPGGSISLQIPILGKDFKHGLTATIAGANASLFKIKVGSLSMDAVSLNAKDVMSADGYALTVCYSPLEVTPEQGFDFATLVINGSDLEQPVTVNLQGRCDPLIELNAVTVLPAEDITPTGYTVRWLPSTADVDGYTVTRKVYETNETATPNVYTYEVDGDTTSLSITDREAEKREAISVKASLNGVESPEGNEITIDAETGLETVETPADSVHYYDTTGMALPGKPEQPGVYVIRVGNHTSKTVIIK